nr:cell division protein FtsZ [Clostridia bacterium]
NAFEIADDVLRRGVQSVSELINVPGFVNLDFADVTTIMKNAGYAHMGVGAAKGSDKAQLAAMAAISSPLLETSIAGATGVLISITASEDIQLDEVETASRMVYEEAHPDATIIWGAAFAPELQDEMRITIIATGFDSSKQMLTNAMVDNAPAEEAPVSYTTPAQEPEAPVYAPQAAPTPAPAPTAPLAPERKPEPAPEVKTTTAAEIVEEYDDVITFIRKIKK